MQSAGLHNFNMDIQAQIYAHDKVTGIQVFWRLLRKQCKAVDAMLRHMSRAMEQGAAAIIPS